MLSSCTLATLLLNFHTKFHISFWGFELDCTGLCFIHATWYPDFYKVTSIFWIFPINPTSHTHHSVWYSSDYSSYALRKNVIHQDHIPATGASFHSWGHVLSYLYKKCHSPLMTPIWSLKTLIVAPFPIPPPWSILLRECLTK